MILTCVLFVPSRLRARVVLNQVLLTGVLVLIGAWAAWAAGAWLGVHIRRSWTDEVAGDQGGDCCTMYGTSATEGCWTTTMRTGGLPNWHRAASCQISGRRGTLLSDASHSNGRGKAMTTFPSTATNPNNRPCPPGLNGLPCTLRNL
jgi:hypothetical protein